MVYGPGTQLAPLTNHQSLTCAIFIAARLGSEQFSLICNTIFLFLTIRWRASSKKIWAYCGKMCKSIQSARETKGLLFPLRTCTRAALCSKISMNRMAQLLLTTIDLIQVNFLGSFFFVTWPKSSKWIHIRKVNVRYEKLQWNIVAAELST